MAKYQILDTYLEATFNFRTLGQMLAFADNLHDDAMTMGRCLHELKIIEEFDNGETYTETRYGFNSKIDDFLGYYMSVETMNGDPSKDQLLALLKERGLETMSDVESAFFQRKLLQGKTPFTPKLFKLCVELMELACGKGFPGEISYAMRFYETQIDLY